MLLIRIRYRPRGGHVHCRVFTASSNDGTWEKCGELVFDQEEWLAFSGMLPRLVEIIHEDERPESDGERDSLPFLES